jgi:guanylate kinase
MSTSGAVFVVVAPSGAGKTSLVNGLLRERTDLRLSVSSTTRSARPGERDGVDYNFIDVAEFERRRSDGEFLESAYVHGNYYGTSRFWIDQTMGEGYDVVLEIDWQGARQVRAAYPAAIGIFILPPSPVELRRRLLARAQDDPAVVERRLAAAKDEIAHIAELEYVIINQEFAAALKQLCAIVDASRLRAARQLHAHHQLLADFGYTVDSTRSN